MNEGKEICAACGGSCCKSMPGSVDPADVGVDQVVEMLSSRPRRYAIDWWEGDPTDGDEEQAYYLRAAVCWPRGIFHGSHGGPCTFLVEDGCSLPHDARPRECRELVPRARGRCEQSWDKKDAAIAWMRSDMNLSKIGYEVEDTEVMGQPDVG